MVCKLKFIWFNDGLTFFKFNSNSFAKRRHITILNNNESANGAKKVIYRYRSKRILYIEL